MNSSSSSNSDVSVVGQSSDENIQVNKDLKSKLEKEQKDNEESHSEISRLKLELQTTTKALKKEQERYKKLEEYLEYVQESFEEEKKEETERVCLLIKCYVQEVESLKKNLEKEDKLKGDYFSTIKAGRDIRKRMKKEISELQNQVKETENLKMSLEKERKLKDNYFSELKVEKDIAENLKKQINELQNQVKETENLKMSLEKERKLKKNYFSELKVEKNFAENLKKKINELQNQVKETENLKMSLEKEIKLKENYSELNAKKNVTENLKKQINELKPYSEKEYKKEIECLKSILQEIDDLKSKLQNEKRINQSLSSSAEHLKTVAEVNRTSFIAQIQKLENEIKLLKEKDLLQQERLKSCNATVNLSETVAVKELKAKESALTVAQHLHVLPPQTSTCDCAYYYELLDKETKILKQDFQKHSLDLENTMKLQNRHYSTLDDKIKKHCDSIEVESILQKMLKHPLFLSYLKKSVISVVNNVMPSKTVPDTPVINVQNDPDENTTSIKPLGIHQQSGNGTLVYVCPGVAVLSKKKKRGSKMNKDLKARWSLYA